MRLAARLLACMFLEQSLRPALRLGWANSKPALTAGFLFGRDASGGTITMIELTAAFFPAGMHARWAAPSDLNSLDEQCTVGYSGIVVVPDAGHLRRATAPPEFKGMVAHRLNRYASTADAKFACHAPRPSGTSFQLPNPAQRLEFLLDETARHQDPRSRGAAGSNRSRRDRRQGRGRQVRLERADEAARPAGGVRHGVRHAGGSAVELRLGRDHRRRRREAVPVSGMRDIANNPLFDASRSGHAALHLALRKDVGNHAKQPALEIR